MNRPGRIAVVHYHLRPGGVTRVIANAVEALSEQGIRCAVLAGEIEAQAARDMPGCAVVPGLQYGATDRAYPPGDLITEMRAACKRILGAPPDLWHIHNHSLGKNLTLPGCVGRLAREKEPLVLQIHDFPEDGRPDNYRYLLNGFADDPARLSGCLYPRAAHVHFAVLNGRDYEYLGAAGMAREHLHLLPNAVAVSDAAEALPPPASDSPRIFLYPTRGIRRKNLGEFLLWSALANPDDLFATSLIPRNPVWRDVHDRWVAFAKELNLPVEFARGRVQARPFEAVMAESHEVITTSVAEGFGLAFLEPWLMGRSLSGRNLPDVTREFSAAGVDLARLYDRLMVPLAWVGEDDFRERVQHKLAAFLKAYGREITPADTQRAVHAAVDGGRVDFGRLDEALQERVIRQIIEMENPRGHIMPPMLTPGNGSTNPVASNQRVIRKAFGLKQYAQRLLALYDRVLSASPSAVDALAPRQVLDRYLNPERFMLLRS
jgi:glycosyltransferase involved in cell wall biosynthesis